MEARNNPLQGRQRAWLLMVLALVLGASFPYLSRMMNANERPRVLQAVALVDAGQWAIDGAPTREIPPGIDVARSPVDGRLYPNKPPGATIPAALGYLVARSAASLRGAPPNLRDVTWWTRVFGGLLPTMVLAWFLVRRLARAPSAVVLVLVATPMLTYARLLFGHAFAACLLTIGAIVVVESLKGDDPPVKALAGGVIAGAAVTVEYGAALAGLPLAVMVAGALRHEERRRTATAAIVGAGISLALLAIYQDRFFGSPWSTPYHHVVDEGFAETHARGLLGLTFPTATSVYEHLLSPWGGALYWAPLCVAIAALAFTRWKTLTPLARLATATFATALAFNLCLQQTGGWRVGPRYLVVAMPLCVVPLAELLPEIMRRRALAIGLVALALWSTFINLLAANVWPQLIPEGNPLVDQLLPLWVDGRAPYGVLAPILGPRGGLLVVVLLTVGVLAWALLRLSWSDPRELLRTTVFGLVVAVALATAAALVDPAPDAEANLQSIEGIWEPNGPNAVAHRLLPPL